MVNNVNGQRQRERERKREREGGDWRKKRKNVGLHHPQKNKVTKLPTKGNIYSDSISSEYTYVAWLNGPLSAGSAITINLWTEGPAAGLSRLTAKQNEKKRSGKKKKR